VNPPQEGTRIGRVRRPSRGVRKRRYAINDWFDVWLADLAPSTELVAQGQAAATEPERKRLVRAFKAEIALPTARPVLDILTALSHDTNLSIGCYVKTKLAAIGRCFASYCGTAAPSSCSRRNSRSCG
jgi:uncharacterized protein YeaO (DUF488 family)